MNKLSLFIILSALFFVTACKKDEGLTEEQKTSFIKIYSAASTGMSMVQTADGGFAMVGFTSQGVDGSNDVLLVKTDEYGNQQWKKQYDIIIQTELGFHSDDVGNDIAITHEGRVRYLRNVNGLIFSTRSVTSGYY